MKIESILLAVALVVCTADATAAGGGGGGGGGSGGDEWGATDAASRDPDFKAGVAAWKAKQWPQVIERMSTVISHDARNADAWNYRAYAHRQLGEMQLSFSDYERALQIDPNHRAAHEYMGEAYLQVGDLAHAEQHLRLLDKLCWLPCEEYSELKEKVAAYKRDHAL